MWVKTVRRAAFGAVIFLCAFTAFVAWVLKIHALTVYVGLAAIGGVRLLLLMLVTTVAAPSSSVRSRATPRRLRLDDFNRTLLDFVIQWRRYGGPPGEETPPLFGIRQRGMPQRIRTITSVWVDQGSLVC